MRQTYDNKGKAIAGFDLIELQTNGHEIKRKSYPACMEEAADRAAYDLNEEFGHSGVEFFIRVRRYC